MTEKKSSVSQKQEAIQSQKGENKRSVAQLHTSVRKFRADIQDQTKVNAAAVTHMYSGTQKILDGVRELERVNAAAITHLHGGTQKIVAGIKELGRANTVAVKKMQEEGAQRMQTGIDAQRKAFRAGGQAMHAGVMQISADIHKLAQVNKQFAHEFYFG